MENKKTATTCLSNNSRSLRYLVYTIVSPYSRVMGDERGAGCGWDVGCVSRTSLWEIRGAVRVTMKAILNKTLKELRRALGSHPLLVLPQSQRSLIGLSG